MKEMRKGKSRKDYRKGGREKERERERERERDTTRECNVFIYDRKKIQASFDCVGEAVASR